jgi:hypothetical protein
MSTYEAYFFWTYCKYSTVAVTLTNAYCYLEPTTESSCDRWAFFVSGGVQIFYDIMLLISFQHMKAEHEP